MYNIYACERTICFTVNFNDYKELVLKKYGTLTTERDNSLI